MRNIENVIKKEVCTGCGFCANICPKQCIETRLDLKSGYYKTYLDTSCCVDCGLCRKVCPVYTWNNTESNPYLTILVIKTKYYTVKHEIKLLKQIIKKTANKLNVRIEYVDKLLKEPNGKFLLLKSNIKNTI